MDTTESKTIYGDVWIDGNTLVQEQILIVPGVGAFNNTVALIEDIYGDLTSGSGTFKSNGKKYFYWEVTMTDIEDDDVTHTVNIECPKLSSLGEDYIEEFISTFSEEDPEDIDSDYAKYWAKQLKDTQKNFDEKIAIQKKEIVFPGTSYVNSSGDVVTTEETRQINNDLGDITNLLGIF